MSNQDTGSAPFGRRENSEEVSVEIYLLGCGHGDTIFLRFPDDRWILVDCHLRDRYTRSHFFEFVREKSVERLEYIFQTHPDFDHLCGMVEVLDYFTTEGRTIGYWCDGGLGAAQVGDLIWEEALSEKEHARLHNRLDELSDEGLVQTALVNDWSGPISPKGYANSIDLFPVAPPASLVRKITRGNIRKLAKNLRAKLESNALSLVMVLSLVAGERDCNVLLSADACVEEISAALKTWEQRAKERGLAKGFDIVKVPHHGSITSHTTDLCRAKRTDRKQWVAGVSAGVRRALPDREVIRAYLDEDWVVLLTTTRKGTVRANYLMEVADKLGMPSYAISRQDVKISWNSTEGLEWGPPEARVERADLALYQTKTRTK